jgi:RNA polymerase sigma-70 factor (ECF subfamily)
MYIKKDMLDIDKIIDDFSGYLYTIIQNSANFQKEDIEEIIADTYLILWNNQYKLDLDKKLSSYLVGIVKNLIKQKYKLFYNNNENIENYEELLIVNESIDVVIENNEVNRKIIELLNKMKKEDKEIFYEYYFYSRKIKEIATINNISESKVKVILHRTRNKLRKELLKGGYGFNG